MSRGEVSTGQCGLSHPATGLVPDLAGWPTVTESLLIPPRGSQRIDSQSRDSAGAFFVLTAPSLLYSRAGPVRSSIMTIRFTPLASESLGVRSMAVMVETPDLRILLDAGAALGFRHGLLPHPKEYVALREARRRIAECAERADAVTISHYHFDHYTATWKTLEEVWTLSSYEEAGRIYGGKTVYAKDYRASINPSQRRRGYLFNKIASDFIHQTRYSDSKRFRIGGTSLRFTSPLPHGEEGSALGYVVGVIVSHGSSKLMFCPDVQGPMTPSALRVILRASPDVLIVGGPPEYLSEFRVPPAAIGAGMANLGKIVQRVRLTIIEHHILRSESGLRMLIPLRQVATENGNQVSTAAEHLGLENQLLEATRRELYENFPPDPEFQKWMRRIRRRRLLPPA